MKKLTQFVYKSVFVTCALTTSLVASAASDVNDIIKRSEQAAYYAGNDGRSAARMMIVDGQGRKQMRQFTIMRKDVEDGGDQKMLVFFSRPADVKGMVFRVEKHAKIEQDDDRWLYLPGLDLVKRISAGDKRTSFVGSHFYYEDVSGRAIKEDNFRLISEDETKYVIEATPKVPESVEFSRYIVEIDKQIFIPRLISFFDQQDKNYRKVEAVTIETIQGYPTVVRSKVTDLESGGYTLMEFKGVKYDLGLPDDIFSERSLRTPPQTWLRK